MKKFRKRLHKAISFSEFYELQYAYYYFVPIWFTIHGFYRNGDSENLFTEIEGKEILKKINSVQDAKNYTKESKANAIEHPRNIYL